MDFLIFGVAALGLIIAKTLLSKQERDIQNRRAQRKVKQLQEDAERNASMQHYQEGEVRSSSAKPPPLPTKKGN